MATDWDGKPRKNRAALIVGGTITFASTVFYLGVCVWIAKGCPPVSPWLWHSIMRACQSVALMFGAWGMMAEQAYTTALEESRLS